MNNHTNKKKKKEEGDLFGFFVGKYGVRQSDPLSPYLFIVCIECFPRMLHLAA
jgi:hypothetical protein